MVKTLTVFTPTFNRAYCLHKCYESLVRQTLKDFIWLIIDDGSTDNTKDLVDKWKKRIKFQSNIFINPMVECTQHIMRLIILSKLS